MTRRLVPLTLAFAGFSSKCLLLALFMTALLLPTPVLGQVEAGADPFTERILRSQLELHDEIRLTLQDGSQRECKLAGTTDRAILVYDIPGSSPTSFRFEELSKVEKLHPGQVAESMGVGMGLGILAGLAATFAVVAATEDPYAPLAAIYFVPIGFVAGGLIGVGVGGKSRWETVYLEPEDPAFWSEQTLGGLESQELQRALLTGTLPRDSRLRLEFPDRESYEVMLVQSDHDSIYVRAERISADTVAFGYEELHSIDYLKLSTERKTSTLAVIGGAAVGLGIGIAVGYDENSGGQTIGAAMAGVTLGGIAGGILGSKTREKQEWEKFFVVPRKDGVMLGYHTRF